MVGDRSARPASPAWAASRAAPSLNVSACVCSMVVTSDVHISLGGADEEGGKGVSAPPLTCRPISVGLPSEN